MCIERLTAYTVRYLGRLFDVWRFQKVKRLEHFTKTTGVNVLCCGEACQYLTS